MGFYCVFRKKRKKARQLGLTSLNTVGKLWFLGIIFESLFLTLGKQGSGLLECKSQIKEVAQSLGSRLAGVPMRIPFAITEDWLTL